MCQLISESYAFIDRREHETFLIAKYKTKNIDKPLE